ncbi:MAG: 5-oxoprolinase subunit PxpB [Flavobacteriaceae bacterium]|nr:5-oxoprolinase subunit PxpB [Flavobacteriaceae bacterium]
MKQKFKLSFFRVNEFAVSIDWGNVMHEDIHRDILRFKFYLKRKITFKDISHGFSSILIQFEETIVNYHEICNRIKILYKESQELHFHLIPKHWKIPVCYESPFAIDLEFMSKKLKLSTQEIINYHTRSKYIIYFIGFLPGFFYLGGLNRKIHFPRRDNPRKRIAPGSIGIGEKQTGIYPVESPGGWNIIGYTPYSFFDPYLVKKNIPQSGDTIEFFSISKQEIDKYSND